MVQLTKDATRISPADHERLRAVGFDDKGILQITLIASWFNLLIVSPMPWALADHHSSGGALQRIPMDNGN